MSFPEAIGPGYVSFCGSLLGVLVTAMLVAMIAYWRRRHEFQMRIRSPLMVMISASYSILLVAVVLVREMDNFGLDFPCRSMLWVTQGIAPVYAWTHLVRGIRLWVLATPSARRFMPYVSVRGQLLIVLAVCLFPHTLVGLIMNFTLPQYTENKGGCLIAGEWYIYLILPPTVLIPTGIVGSKLKGFKDFFSVRKELIFFAKWTGTIAQFEFAHLIAYMYSPWVREELSRYFSPHWWVILFCYPSNMYCLLAPWMWDRKKPTTVAQKGNNRTVSEIGSKNRKANWTLEDIMNNSQATKMLLDFAKHSLTIESVMFCVDAENFRTQVLARDDIQQDKAMASVLRQAYLKPGRSPYEINVSKADMRGCKAKINSMDSLTQAERAQVFADVQAEVFKLLRFNLLDLFLQYSPFVVFTEAQALQLQQSQQRGSQMRNSLVGGSAVTTQLTTNTTTTTVVSATDVGASPNTTATAPKRHGFGHHRRNSSQGQGQQASSPTINGNANNTTTTNASTAANTNASSPVVNARHGTNSSSVEGTSTPVAGPVSPIIIMAMPLLPGAVPDHENNSNTPHQMMLPATRVTSGELKQHSPNNNNVMNNNDASSSSSVAHSLGAPVSRQFASTNNAQSPTNTSSLPAAAVRSNAVQQISPRPQQQQHVPNLAITIPPSAPAFLCSMGVST